MFNKLLIPLLFFSSLFASQSDRYILITHNHPQETFIDGIKIYCNCGQLPVFVMVFNGKLEAYCQQHKPIVEHVRRTTPERLKNLMESIIDEPKNDKA